MKAQRQELANAQFEQMFTNNVDSVFNVAQRLLWNRADAEEVVQTTFLKAITRLDQLRDLSRARPWLLQIAYRDAISLLRKRRDRPTDPALLPEQPSLHPGPGETVVASETARILAVALASLDESERVAVTLRDIEDLPMRDVAAVMGVGLSAAKMRVHRGRESLRINLQGVV